MSDDETEFGSALIESLQEGLAWRRGEADLDVVDIDPMTPERVRAIRTRSSKSVAEFEGRFGLAAATMTEWEDGRLVPDPAARLLLRMIEADPEAVERLAARAA